MDYPRQFIICDHKVELPQFDHIKLSRGGVLSYHRELKVYYNIKHDFLLLGYVWQVIPERKSPYEEIADLLEAADGLNDIYDQVLELEETWCGRYAIIFDGNVLLDASGILGIFYSDIGVSSNCTLLGEVMGLTSKVFQSEGNINYLPAPLTHYPEIRRVLPSQIYNFLDRSLKSRQLLAKNCPNFTDESERIGYFVKLFSASLRNISALFSEKKILVALTGGYDSRTLLALAKYSGIDFAAYTLEHDNMTIGDTELPAKISDVAGCEYYYGARDAKLFDADLEKTYTLFTSGFADDTDKTYYAHQQYQGLVKENGNGVVLLRSSVWENVVEYYRKFIGDKFIAEDIYGNFALNKNDLAYKSLSEYFDWCNGNPQSGLSDCNRFFWEQREGSWLSSIELGFDLLDDTVSLQAVNSRIFMSLLMQFPREERIVKEPERKITNYAFPKIKDIPYGTTKKVNKNKLQWFKNKWLKCWDRLRTMGFRKTVLTYIKIFSAEREDRRLRKK